MLTLITRMSLHMEMIECYNTLSDNEVTDQSITFDDDLEVLRTEPLTLIDDMTEEIRTNIPLALGQVEPGERNQTVELPKASRVSLSIVGLKTVVNGRFTRQHH